MRVVAPLLRHAAQHSKPAPNLDALREWARSTQAPAVLRSEARKDEGRTQGAENMPTVRARPQSLDEVIGQEALVGQLRMVCAGSQLRGTPMPHVLVSGPAGMGKTSLAGVVAKSLGAALIVQNGTMLRKPQDLVGLLVKIQVPTVILIDEVHACPKPVQEMLYTVLEDARIDIIGGSGMDAVSYSYNLVGVTVIGATTRPGLLTVPFRDRFGAQFVMADYSIEELARIVAKGWDRVGMAYDPGEPLALAQRGRGVPRRCLHLAERVLDYMAVQDIPQVSEGTVSQALAVFGIDSEGLDDVDFRILSALTNEYAGKSVGLDALAQYLDLDARTLTEQYEPWLARRGWILRQKSGRMASPEAYDLVKGLAA